MEPSNHTVTPGTGALPERSIHRFHGGEDVCVIDNSKCAKFNSWSGIIYKWPIQRFFEMQFHFGSEFVLAVIIFNKWCLHAAREATRFWYYSGFWSIIPTCFWLLRISLCGFGAAWVISAVGGWTSVWFLAVLLRYFPLCLIWFLRLIISDEEKFLRHPVSERYLETVCVRQDFAIPFVPCSYIFFKLNYSVWQYMQYVSSSYHSSVLHMADSNKVQVFTCRSILWEYSSSHVWISQVWAI